MVLQELSTHDEGLDSAGALSFLLEEYLDHGEEI